MSGFKSRRVNKNTLDINIPGVRVRIVSNGDAASVEIETKDNWVIKSGRKFNSLIRKVESEIKPSVIRGLQEAEDSGEAEQGGLAEVPEKPNRKRSYFQTDSE